MGLGRGWRSFSIILVLIFKKSQVNDQSSYRGKRGKRCRQTRCPLPKYSDGRRGWICSILNLTALLEFKTFPNLFTLQSCIHPFTRVLPFKWEKSPILYVPTPNMQLQELFGFQDLPQGHLKTIAMAQPELQPPPLPFISLDLIRDHHHGGSIYSGRNERCSSGQ